MNEALSQSTNGQQPEKNITTNTSFYPEPLKNSTYDQFRLPTYGIIILLVLTFLVLKVFIYMRDEKRNNK